jgi:hypothetical protein
MGRVYEVVSAIAAVLGETRVVCMSLLLCIDGVL